METTTCLGLFIVLWLARILGISWVGFTRPTVKPNTPNFKVVKQFSHKMYWA